MTLATVGAQQYLDIDFLVAPQKLKEPYLRSVCVNSRISVAGCLAHQKCRTLLPTLGGLLISVSFWKAKRPFNTSSQVDPRISMLHFE